MTSLTQSGGTIYIRQDGSDIQYSSNNSSWLTISSWPVTITNTNPANFLNVLFTGSVAFSSSNNYFICGSDSIQFGSESLIDADHPYKPSITIDSIVGYTGLIRNYVNLSTGYNNIRVYNLNVDGSSSTLSNGYGWIGYQYFGRGATGNLIINCSSQGDISTGSGGILGEYAAYAGGTLTLLGCFSTGEIGDQGGGIVGRNAGDSSANLTIQQCYATGAVSGEGCGGIVGAGAISVTIEKCYSTDEISGNNAGGIVGGNPGSYAVVISTCYSTGAVTGANAGGICGSLYIASGTLTISITNCYTTGNLNNSGVNNNGLICGFITSSGSVSITITNCYTIGTVDSAKGYIVANVVAVNGVTADYTLSSNYSEAGSGGTPGSWSETHANARLQGVPSSQPGVGTSWASTGNDTPYEIALFGITPYQLQTVSGTDLVQSFSQSVQQGESSSTALNADASGNAFAILQIEEGDSTSYDTISISAQTGAISTTSATKTGIYNIYVRSIGSYHITLFYLIVTSPSSTADPGCCNFSLDLRGIDYTTRAEVLSGNMILSIVNTRREAISYTDLLRIKQAMAFKR